MNGSTRIAIVVCNSGASGTTEVVSSIRFLCVATEVADDDVGCSRRPTTETARYLNALLDVSREALT